MGFENRSLQLATSACALWSPQTALSFSIIGAIEYTRDLTILTNLTNWTDGASWTGRCSWTWDTGGIITRFAFNVWFGTSNRRVSIFIRSGVSFAKTESLTRVDFQEVLSNLITNELGIES